MAGTSKSTIAHMVAHCFHKEGCLGVSFFFSRGQEDLGDAIKFVTTLTAQLIEMLLDLKCHVCDVIDNRGDIAHQILPNQWKQLILQLLLMLDKSLLLPL